MKEGWTIKTDEIAGACRKREKLEKCIQNLTANQKGNYHLAEWGALWRIIQMLVLEEE